MKTIKVEDTLAVHTETLRKSAGVSETLPSFKMDGLDVNLRGLRIEEEKPVQDHTQRRTNRRRKKKKPAPDTAQLHDYKAVAHDASSPSLPATFPDQKRHRRTSKQDIESSSGSFLGALGLNKCDLSDIQALHESMESNKTTKTQAETLRVHSSVEAKNINTSQLGASFMPFKPIKSVPQSRQVSPWRIDKSHRFSSHRTWQNPRAANGTLPLIGRWTGSPPLTASHNIHAFTSKAPNSSVSAKKTEAKPSPWRLVKPLPVPKPETTYLTLASRSASRLKHPQRLLLVLDLNGTLLYRKVGSSNYTPRPFLPQFLSYCLSNHSVLIWSSATPRNVSEICARLFTPEQRNVLVGEWARDTFDLTAAQYAEKIQVYKGLDRIWASEELQRTHHWSDVGGKWDQHNTLLLDDSVLKAIAQPHNLVQMPEFTRSGDRIAGDDVLGQVTSYLEEARMWDNVSSFVMTSRFQADRDWSWDWSTMRSLRQARTTDSDEESGGANLEKGVVL